MPLEPDRLPPAEVIDAYRELELWLLTEIRARLQRVGNMSDWQKLKLTEAQTLRRAVQEAMAKAPGVDNVAENAYIEGALQAAADIAEQSPATPVKFPDTTAVAAIHRKLTEDYANLQAGILRGVDDAWREIVRTVTTRTATGAQDIQTAIRDAANQAAKQGITAYTDNKGRKWRADTYLEMATRTATNNALMAGNTHTMATNGHDLVKVSSHPNPADVCAPYEHQILSISGQNTGTVRMPSATSDATITVHVKDSLSGAISHGFRHPNCRHRWTPFIPGATRQQPPPEPNPEGYKATQKQRYLERQIRAWKRREALAITPVDKATAKTKIRLYQQKLRDHVKKHNLPRRRHREANRPGLDAPREYYQFGVRTRPYPTLDDVPRLKPPKGAEEATRTNPRRGETVTNNIPRMGGKPYNPNCVRCTTTYELRRRGYNLTAGAGRFPKRWDDPESNSQQALNLGWVTPDGTPPRWMLMPTNQQSIQYLTDQMPIGARGFARGKWDIEGHRHGHMWAWEKTDDGLVFHDPQTGKTFMDPMHYGSRLEEGSFRFVRIDDATPTDGALDVVGGDIDSWL